MKKPYPLSIDFHCTDNDFGYMSKGHHDADAFMSAVKEFGCIESLGNPIHVWLKVVPSKFEGYSCWRHQVPQGTRGAFPATVVHEGYHDDRYDWKKLNYIK